MSQPLPAFQFEHRSRIVFGADTVDEVGAIAQELCGQPGGVLLVTDQGLVEAGHAERVRRSIEQAGLSVTVFDAVHENPTTDDVEACLAIATQQPLSLIVGLGGGSSLDCAKGCNFLLTNGGRMQDYWGVGKATKPMLPLIAIPTTAGTGSDAQSFALIADATTHQKMACGDRKALPAVAILDPTLASSQPQTVMACSGLDSIAHAVETAVTRPRNPVSTMFSREAFRLAQANFPRVMAAPDDLEAQGSMLLAATYAGIAIENSMLGACHSLANPLTATFGVIHGQAVGMMLPHVVRFNAEDQAAARAYALLAESAGLCGNGQANSGVQPIEILVQRLEELLAASRLPATLDQCGVTPAATEDLARGAAKQWTAQFNPREVDTDDLRSLYLAAFP